NELAKEAATGNPSPTNQLPHKLRGEIPQSISAMRAAYTKRAVSIWKDKWKASPRFERMTAIDQEFPFKKF
ncbi:hypothetical protein DL96DRAFT_1434404, partial [Flagelloscypha sp. PMI_526]